jgi:hypothetical protein
MSRLQGMVYVHFVGYAMKGATAPALVPITLQPWRSSAITVQVDAYRPLEANPQAILFSTNKLDPTETYTITITKTNATLDIDLNVDSFILTQPDVANSASLPGINLSASASELASDSSLPPFVASSTVIGSTTLTGPLVTHGVSSATSIDNGSPIQSSSIANANSSSTSNASAIVGAIVGGVIGGIVIGIIVVFLIFRWYSKWDQRKRSLAGSDAVPTPLYTAPPAYPGATPPYPSEHASAPSQTTIPAVTGHYSVPSRLVGASLPLNTALEQSSVNVRTEMAQVQRSVPSTPQIHTKTRYTGNSRHYNLISASQPPVHVVPPLSEDTESVDAILPAYS